MAIRIRPPYTLTCMPVYYIFIYICELLFYIYIYIYASSPLLLDLGCEHLSHQITLASCLRFIRFDLFDAFFLLANNESYRARTR